MTDDQLILRPSSIDDDRMIDDYRVFFEGRPIGRIKRFERAWDWIIDPAAPIAARASGSAAGLDKVNGPSGRLGNAFTLRSRRRTSPAGT
jgi:hypothetical protein